MREILTQKGTELKSPGSSRGRIPVKRRETPIIVEKPKRFGLCSSVPKVFEKDGFEFRIYPNDHDPAHVHVFKAGKGVKIGLRIAGRPKIIRIFGMNDRDVKKGLNIVAENHGFLLRGWRQVHGKD